MHKLIIDIPDDDVEKIKANYAPTSQYLAMKYMLDAINSGTIYDNLEYKKQCQYDKGYSDGYDKGINEMYKAFSILIDDIGGQHRKSAEYLFDLFHPYDTLDLIMNSNINAYGIIDFVNRYLDKKCKIDVGDEIKYVKHAKYPLIVTKVYKSSISDTLIDCIEKTTLCKMDGLKMNRHVEKTGNHYDLSIFGIEQYGIKQYKEDEDNA